MVAGVLSTLGAHVDWSTIIFILFLFVLVVFYGREHKKKVLEKMAVVGQRTHMGAQQEQKINLEKLSESVVIKKRSARKATRNIPSQLIQRVASTLPDQIVFLYENADGDIALRDVNVTSKYSNERGDFYIAGYCLKARASRTFRTDRIIGTITRSSTGEILSVEEWWKLFADITPRFIAARAPTVYKTGPVNIMFTGYRKAEREVMESFAENAGWTVRKTISKTLDYLMAGKNAGPSKTKDAIAYGVEIVTMSDVESFREWLEEAVEVT